MRAPGGLGNVGALAPQVAPSLGRWSELPNEEVPVTLSAGPFLTADASSLEGVLKYGVPDGTETALPPADPNAPGLSSQATMGSDNVPERRLVGRVVNLSAPASPNAPPLSPDWSDAASGASSPPLAQISPTPNAIPSPSAANTQASAPPLLGIFSGKPMPDWPVRPSIFQTEDQASPDDNELFQRWMRWVDASAAQDNLRGRCVSALRWLWAVGELLRRF